MPAKGTDWKKERNRTQTEATPFPGNLPHFPTDRPPGEGSLPMDPRLWNVLLEPNTRHSDHNSPDLGPGEISANQARRVRHSRDEMKKRIEEAKKRNPKTYRERLKGLFGGG